MYQNSPPKQCQANVSKQIYNSCILYHRQYIIPGFQGFQLFSGHLPLCSSNLLWSSCVIFATRNKNWLSERIIKLLNFLTKSSQIEQCGLCHSSVQHFGFTMELWFNSLRCVACHFMFDPGETSQKVPKKRTPKGPKTPTVYPYRSCSSSAVGRQSHPGIEGHYQVEGWGPLKTFRKKDVGASKDQEPMGKRKDVTSKFIYSGERLPCAWCDALVPSFYSVQHA